jgi:hypothetical protein
MASKYIVDDPGPSQPLNAKADWGFMLGLMALVPCLGLPFGCIGIVLGFQGRAEIKRGIGTGAGRAIAGIICCGFSILYHVLMIVVFVLMLLLQK